MDGQGFVNEGAARDGARMVNGNRSVATRIRGGEQPQPKAGHRATDMLFFRVPLSLVLATVPALLMAQNGAAPAPPAPPTVSANLRPALGQVAQTLSAISVRRWKAPNPVRDAADANVASIQRDLNGTLAGLLQQADAAPGSVPAAFAVYRNVDALYDTLLRVVETAELAAPDNEEAQLESALKSLEGARSSLGDAIQSGSQSQQAELVQLRTAVATASAAQKAPVRTMVVDDGPTPAKTTHHKRTTSTTNTKKPAATPAQPAATGQNPSSPQ
jgi:hypothetical protein